MPKLIWEKKLQEAVKRQESFGCSVREMKGSFFVQIYYRDIDKRASAALPIRWEPNQKLNVLNALQKINEVMQNSGCSLKEAVETLCRNNTYKININWNKLVYYFKKYKNISKSSWEGNYSYFLKDIVAMMGSSNEPKTGKAILEKLVQNKDKGVGRKRVISNVNNVLNFYCLSNDFILYKSMKKRYEKDLIGDNRKLISCTSMTPVINGKELVYKICSDYENYIESN